jgi:hypothetical protein
VRIRAASALARLALATVTVAAIAACGSGATASTAPTIDAAASEAPEASTVVAPPIEASPNPAAASAASEAPAEPPSGGGAAGDVCSLVTADELAGILGVPVKAAVLKGPPDSCDVQSADGAPLAAFVLNDFGSVATSAAYDAYASDAGAVAVPGIGEKAAYDPAQGLLLTVKHGVLLSVSVFDDGSGDDAARLELMKKIATIAAGRM